MWKPACHLGGRLFLGGLDVSGVTDGLGGAAVGGVGGCTARGVDRRGGVGVAGEWSVGLGGGVQASVAGAVDGLGVVARLTTGVG